MPIRRRVSAAVAWLFLAACGTPAGPHLEANILVPHVDAQSNFGFDIGAVSNNGPGRYYLADRTNQSVDVFDIATKTIVGQITGGFTGCRPTLDCVATDLTLSGPTGVNPIPGTNLLFVGDVEFVRVIDTTRGPAGQVVNNIRVGVTDSRGLDLRADEGCFDADHQIYMISTPDALTPYASFINTKTQTVIATVLFTDPAGGPSGVAAAVGLEACNYDPITQSFLVNNDGTKANLHGEVDVIPASLITPFLTAPMAAGTNTTLAALGPTVNVFPLGNCDPSGMALGPGTDVAIECRPATKGAPLVTLILNRVSGSILAAVPFGGGDQIAYDSASNRYYVAAPGWSDTGVSPGPGCSPSNPCNPAVGVIDGANRTVTAILPAGAGCHSIAVDPVSGRVFVPFAPPPGCVDCANLPYGIAANFPNGGISIYRTH